MCLVLKILWVGNNYPQKGAKVGHGWMEIIFTSNFNIFLLPLSSILSRKVHLNNLFLFLVINNMLNQFSHFLQSRFTFNKLTQILYQTKPEGGSSPLNLIVGFDVNSSNLKADCLAKCLTVTG